MDSSAMNQPAHFGSIHIIESLFDKGHSEKTGSRLREVIEPLAAETSPITVHFHNPRTKGEVFGGLENILSQSYAEGRVPLLRFEAHGAQPLPGELTS